MYELDTAYHRIRVVDRDGIRFLMFERRQQGSMYLADPFGTDFAYPAYFHIALALAPAAARTLAVGLGAGMVVKRMWRDYPEMRIDAVELDPDVVQIAQERFALPDDERIRVFTGDGRAFIEAARENWDIVIVDAYDDDHIPRPLTTEEFMREVRDHLSSDGVAVYNFLGQVEGRDSRPFRSLHRTLSNVWRRVWVFRVHSLEADLLDLDHNIIILATDANVSRSELLERIASRVGGRVTVPDFEMFGEDLHSGRIRMRDVPLLVDEAHGKRSRR